MTMTPRQIRAARAKLGELWNKGRPLYASELARSLRLGGRDPGATVLDWESEKTKVSGPVSALLTLYLAGVLPPDGIPEGGVGSGIKSPDYPLRGQARASPQGTGRRK